MNREDILKYFLEFLPNKKDIALASYSLTEEEGASEIQLKLSEDGSTTEITGEGVGMIDAGFNALSKHYSKQYKSLNTIKLEDVYFQVDHRGSKDVSFKSKMDVKLEFSNHCQNRTCFSRRSKSMGFTGVSVLVSAMEFYINCELLFKRLKFLVEDAEERGRQDIASKYKYALSKVVEVTNYQTIS